MKLADNVLEELWFADDDPRRSHEVASRSMAASLARSLALKPFPRAAQEATRLLDERDFKVRALEKTLSSDPALAARVLKVANSPGYNPRKPIETLRSAIVLLGASALRDIVIAAAVQGMFQDSSGMAVGILEHCVGVASILRAMERRRRYRGLPPLFLPGLLHDVGKLLLLQSREFRYARGPMAADQHHLLERGTLGYDHAVLAAHAIRAWKIPEPAAQVVALHHQPARALEAGGNVAVMVSLLRVADQLEYQLAANERLDPRVAEALAQDASFSFIDYGADDLRHLVGDLGEARVKGSKAMGRLFSWKM